MFCLFFVDSNGWPAPYIAHKLPFLHHFSLRCEDDVFKIPLIASSLWCFWFCCGLLLFVCGRLLVCGVWVLVGCLSTSVELHTTSW